MKQKIKYPLWKLIFIGKEPLDRKHAPKIIEYFWIGLSNAITTILTSIFLFQIFKGGQDQLSETFFKTINNFWFKIMFAFLIGNYLTTICSSLRLIRILKKTEEGKVFAYFTLAFSIIPLTQFLGLGFAMLAYTINEIEFI